ncbi:MAG: hypothetical protein IKM34_00135 [Clostridia bacterium]|nr:hypothetical protein [Clostridia bacterium]
MAKKLLVVGDVAIEMLMKFKRLPNLGEVCDEDKYLFLPGGPAGNAALAATYWGADVFLCSRVGKDGNAARLTQFFSDNGINVDAVVTDNEAQTGMIVSFCESGYTEPRTVRYRGASAKMAVEEVDAAIGAKPDGVFISAETDGYIAIHAMEKCDAFGVPVFMDLSEESLMRAVSVKGASLKAVYTTDDTAEQFTAMPVRDVESALKCCLTIAQKITAEIYVIRMKNRGLFLYDGRTYGIIFVTDALDKAVTLGYVNVESAVLAAEYLLHEDAKDACGYAAIADLLAREGKGFRIPTREQVAAYIQKNELPFSV